ncbi:MAG: 50S ribosomal protein L23 [Bacteroidota bacterium]|nr:50S ribosomal protein L23 [Bacteroidota bacterium]MDE2835652.1 50S ribosomal protein L23 [Bacteroidota bacterium]MDE2956430.1 50S ribosomal protein L23 [Bacteroidota bacterium]
MAREILKRPLVTEKLTMLMESGHYAFVVDMKANKTEIRKAVEAQFPEVTVASVRTMIVRGKRRRQTTRRGVREGRTATFKKAIVTLAPDSEQIDFFSSV